MVSDDDEQIDPPHGAPRVGLLVGGRYRLCREIGAGGMGVVFEAIHRLTQRRVAIKLLRDGRNPLLRERLLREAATLGALRHPGIVDVYDAGDDADGAAFMVMELLAGRTLDGLLAARRSLAVAEVANIAAQLCEAVAFAHGSGVLHRDLKPSNVFLVSPPGVPIGAGRAVESPDPGRSALAHAQAKLIDFGIVAIPVAPESKKLTGDRELLGTPEYMAPEQLYGELTAPDERADVYALGVTFFEALTGEVPFSGSYAEIVAKVIQATAPPSLRALRADVPAGFAAAIERALARDRRDRFPDVPALAAALRAAIGPSVPAPSASPADQRRTYARAPYRTPVRLVRSDHSTLDGRSEDISEGGLMVVAPAGKTTAGETAELRFALPTTGTIARLHGVVRWVRPARSGLAAIGFEFADLPRAMCDEIAQYARWMVPAGAVS
jgi:serine/threonine-protein kinase